MGTTYQPQLVSRILSINSITCRSSTKKNMGRIDSRVARVALLALLAWKSKVSIMLCTWFNQHQMWDLRCLSPEWSLKLNSSSLPKSNHIMLKGIWSSKHHFAKQLLNFRRVYCFFFFFGGGGGSCLEVCISACSMERLEWRDSCSPNLKGEWVRATGFAELLDILWLDIFFSSTQIHCWRKYTFSILHAWYLHSTMNLRHDYSK